MRIAILGAGSLGCVFGGLLADAGNEVLLVNRNRALVDRLNAEGLILDLGDTGRRLIKVQADTVCAPDAPVDLLIVLVKSFDTGTALAGARAAIGPGTLLLSLQNGMGHEDLMAPFAAPDQVLLGKTYAGGTMTQPGVVIGGAAGKKTFIGPAFGEVTGRMREVADAFSAAGLACEASAKIIDLAWNKLLVNVSTSGLSALTGLAYGPLYALAEVRSCAHAAVAEGMAVARAAGAKLDFVDPDEPWKLAAEGLPPGFKASMLQCLEETPRTEIDFIHGAVVRHGAHHNIPTPVNATLVAAVKGLEHRITEEAKNA